MEESYDSSGDAICDNLATLLKSKDVLSWRQLCQLFLWIDHNRIGDNNAPIVTSEKLYGIFFS